MFRLYLKLRLKSSLRILAGIGLFRSIILLLIAALAVIIKEDGKAIIISSHQIATLHEICDYIHYLNNQTIVKQYTDESIEEIESDILSL